MGQNLIITLWPSMKKQYDAARGGGRVVRNYTPSQGLRDWDPYDQNRLGLTPQTKKHISKSGKLSFYSICND